MHYLPDWLRRRAALHPNALALISDELRWSFAELDRAADAVAARLLAGGIGAGMRVAALLRNGPAFVALVHALPRIGAILVPLNTRLAPAELVWQLNDCAPSLLLFDRANAARAAALPGPRLELDLVEQTASAPGVLREQIDLDAIQSIIYTSGTTGRPKGALLSYGNHWWSATGSALNLGLHADDRWLAVLPLFHVGGLAILLRCAIYGIPLVLQDGFVAEAVNRALDEQGVTIISLVSTMLQRMLAQRGDLPYPARLRCLLLGGGPAPRPLLDACARRGLPLAQTYGMTETASQVATLAPADAQRKLGSAGQALLPVELRIVNDDGPAAPAEIGEILVRGPVVSPGYWQNPARRSEQRFNAEPQSRSDAEPQRTVACDRPSAGLNAGEQRPALLPLQPGTLQPAAEGSAAAQHDGWLRTGDLGYLDSEGYLYVVDRRSDLILSGGENIYPAEVEAVLLAHPAVAEAGVVGTPDAQWGSVPIAFVVLGDNAPTPMALEEALIAFCRTRLAAYKVPRRISFVAELPRTAAGKLRRNELRRSER